MVKSGSFSPRSELSDFANETRDVVVSYFSLLPVHSRDGSLSGSLTSNSTNSSGTRTFKGDLLIAGRGGKLSLVAHAGLKHDKDGVQKEERTHAKKIRSPPLDSDSEEVDYVDSGRRRKLMKYDPAKRYSRSMSYDESNLRNRSQDVNLPHFIKGSKKLQSGNLLSEPSVVFSRARSVSPARPTTLNVVPVYPPPCLNTSSNISPSLENSLKKQDLDTKSKIESLEKDISKIDMRRKLNYDKINAAARGSALSRQLSNKALERKPASSKSLSSGRSSLQNSQTKSMDRSSMNSDVSLPSKTRSSDTSESLVSVLDWEDDEVKKLVDNSIVSPVALSLKHAIEETLVDEPKNDEAIRRSPVRSRPSDFGKRLSGSLNSKITRSPGGRCTTPQTEVAQLIAAIGDQIQLEYGHILNQAISNAISIPEERIDPRTLGEIISREGLISREQGWKKAVMVLTFCKGLALALIARNRSISTLLDSTVEMLADSVADFVIRQGGWNGILSSDVTPTALLTPVSSSPTDEDVKFPPDWDDVQPEEGQHQTDGPLAHNQEDQFGAVGGYDEGDSQRHRDRTPAALSGSRNSEGQGRGSDSMDDKDLERVRMEIWLMRQISEQYDQENSDRRKWSFVSTAALTVLSLTVLGGALVLFLKRRGRLGAILSFFRK